MTAIDKDYYVRRAREERMLQKAAATPAVAQAHAELAEEYERLLRAAAGDHTPRVDGFTS